MSARVGTAGNTWIHLTVLVCLGLSCCLGGCINVKVVRVGQKTAFERQLIGTYEELDEQLALISSVRSQRADQLSAPEGVDMKSRALAARRRQLFNGDEIIELKRAGCLGENARGQLEGRSCSSESDPKTLERAQRLLKEENEDREVIIELALVLDKSLTPADRPALEKVYAHVMQQAAPKGCWIQGGDGSWRQAE